jgi:hypothetical protein
MTLDPPIPPDDKSLTLNYLTPMRFFPLHLLATILLLSPVALAAPPKVAITFKVTAPASTPSDSKLYIAGNAEVLGQWSASGLELRKDPDGTWTATVPLPKDRLTEYKITRGSWKTVEKNGDGSEMQNRKLTPLKDDTIEIKVAAWADQPKAN